MPRYIWDKQTERFVPAGEVVRVNAARSHLPAPRVVSDNLPDLVNMADGKRYSSKSAFYKAVRSSGCEIVGNESLPAPAEPTAPAGLKDDLRAAIAQHS